MFGEDNVKKIQDVEGRIWKMTKELKQNPLTLEMSFNSDLFGYVSIYLGLLSIKDGLDRKRSLTRFIESSEDRNQYGNRPTKRRY